MRRSDNIRRGPPRSPARPWVSPLPRATCEPRRRARTFQGCSRSPPLRPRLSRLVSRLAPPTWSPARPPSGPCVCRLDAACLEGIRRRGLLSHARAKSIQGTSPERKLHRCPARMANGESREVWFMRHWLAGVIALVGLVVVACGGSSGGSTGSGLCGPNACGGGQTCDPTIGCVQCTTDAQCGASDKFCVLGDCVACRTNADCGASAPACWSGDHKCHASCTGATPTACPKNAPECDPATGACTECLRDGDCAAPAPFCNAQLASCVACRTSTDCSASAPICLATGQCIQCISDSDCGGSTPICDTGDRRCRAGCLSNANCSGDQPICDVTRAECVACTSNVACPPATPFCNQKSSAPPAFRTAIARAPRRPRSAARINPGACSVSARPIAPPVSSARAEGAAERDRRPAVRRCSVRLGRAALSARAPATG